jgi:hypothetical protein
MPSLMPTTLTTSQQRRRREEADEYNYEDIAVMVRQSISPRPPPSSCTGKSHNTSATSSSLHRDGSLSRRNPMSSRRPSSSVGGPSSDMAGMSFTTSHNLSSDATATRPQSSQSDVPPSPDPGGRTREGCESRADDEGSPAASSSRGPRLSLPPSHLMMHRSGVPLTAVTSEFGFSLAPVNPNSVPRRAADDRDSARGGWGGWSPMKQDCGDIECDDTVGFDLADTQPSAEPDRDAPFLAPETSSRGPRHLSPREDSTVTPRRRMMHGPLGSPSTPMHQRAVAASSLGGSLVDAHSSSMRRFQGATDSLGLYRSEEEGGYMGRGVGHDVDTPATLDASFGDVFGERDLEGSYRGR